MTGEPKAGNPMADELIERLRTHAERQIDDNLSYIKTADALMREAAIALEDAARISRAPIPADAVVASESMLWAGWHARGDTTGLSDIANIYAAMVKSAPTHPAPEGAGEPAAAWLITFADGSGVLAFTGEEADDAIADASPGATKQPLFTRPADEFPWVALTSLRYENARLKARIDQLDSVEF